MTLAEERPLCEVHEAEREVPSYVTPICTCPPEDELDPSQCDGCGHDWHSGRCFVATNNSQCRCKVRSKEEVRR